MDIAAAVAWPGNNGRIISHTAFLIFSYASFLASAAIMILTRHWAFSLTSRVKWRLLSRLDAAQCRRQGYHARRYASCLFSQRTHARSQCHFILFFIALFSFWLPVYSFSLFHRSRTICHHIILTISAILYKLLSLIGAISSYFIMSFISSMIRLALSFSGAGYQKVTSCFCKIYFASLLLIDDI